MTPLCFRMKRMKHRRNITVYTPYTLRTHICRLGVKLDQRYPIHRNFSLPGILVHLGLYNFKDIPIWFQISFRSDVLHYYVQHA